MTSKAFFVFVLVGCVIFFPGAPDGATSGISLTGIRLRLGWLLRFCWCQQFVVRFSWLSVDLWNFSPPCHFQWRDLRGRLPGLHTVKPQSALLPWANTTWGGQRDSALTCCHAQLPFSGLPPRLSNQRWCGIHRGPCLGKINGYWGLELDEAEPLSCMLRYYPCLWFCRKENMLRFVCHLLLLERLTD